jgi:hypothetical protein
LVLPLLLLFSLPFLLLPPPAVEDDDECLFESQLFDLRDLGDDLTLISLPIIPALDARLEKRLMPGVQPVALTMRLSLFSFLLIFIGDDDNILVPPGSGVAVVCEVS